MKEVREKYKKYVEYSIVALIMTVIVLSVYTLFKNGEVIIGTLGGGIGRFLDVISPIIYAFGLAYILYRPTMWVEKWLKKLFIKKNANKDKSQFVIRLLSIITIFAIVAGSLILLIQFLVPPIIQNIQQVLLNHADIGEVFQKALPEVKIFLEGLQTNTEMLMNPVEMLIPLIENIGGLVGSVGGLVIDAIATLILTFYFLKDKERLCVAIDRFADLIFSPKVKSYVQVVVADIDEIIGGFIIGTILAGIIVGVISTALMLMIKHPFAVLIGTVAGVTNMIPYVGPLVGAFLALILGILESPSLGITGCILLLLYQQIDGNFIEPKVVGDKIGLSAVWILIVVIIGGSYYGGVGMILSAPVAALVKVYIDRAYRCKMAKRGIVLQDNH